MTIPNNPIVEQWPSYHDRPERPAHIRRQRPPLAPSVGKHAQLNMPGHGLTGRSRHRRKFLS